jgi:hypothetical protein
MRKGWLEEGIKKPTVVTTWLQYVPTCSFQTTSTNICAFSYNYQNRDPALPFSNIMK